MTLLMRDIRAKTAESGIRITVMPMAVKGFQRSSASLEESSESPLRPPLTMVAWVARWSFG